MNDCDALDYLEMMTYDMLDHLESHRVDPENSTIGRTPSQLILDTLTSYPLKSNDMSDGRPIMDEKAHVMNQLQRWMGMESHPRRLGKEIRNLFSNFSSTLNLRRGDLVVVQIDGNGYIG